MPTGTGVGTGLADVLRAIASLSETDRELLLRLLKTLQAATGQRQGQEAIAFEWP